VVANLDADKLDGQHASAFAAAAHTHVKADITDLPWAKADLPSAVAYEDEANTFSSAQTINAALTVTGITTFNTVPYTWPGADAAGTLNSDGAGTLSWGSAGLGGSGTTNAIAKFTAASTIGDSTITDDGSTVTVANPLIVSVTAATIGAAVRATDSGNAYLFFQNSTTGSAVNDGLFIGINSAEQALIFHYETGEPIRIGTQGTERVRVHAAGGFAIGTTQSGELVEIGSSSAEDVYIRISNSSSSSPIGGMIVGIKSDETGVVMVREWEDLIFGTRDVERMRILGTSDVYRVGLGTSTPGAAFTGFGANLLVFDLASANTNMIYFTGDATADDTIIGGLVWLNDDNADATGTGATSKYLGAVRMELETSDANAGDDSGAHMVFQTKPEAGAGQERMRIMSGGNILIGTATDGGYLLEVAGTANVQGVLTANGFTVESQTVTLTGTAWTTLSIGSAADRGAGFAMVVGVSNDDAAATFTFADDSSYYAGVVTRLVSAPAFTSGEQIEMDWPTSSSNLRVRKTGAANDGSYKVTLMHIG
jgi:hypothetical protein